MDIPVLKYLDVFIGLAFVMVLGCTVVAAVTNLTSSVFYLRAQYLRQGLADILQRLDPEALPAELHYIAQLIQRHPGVARAATLPGQFTAWLRQFFGAKVKWLPPGAPATVVQRHEFVRILLEWGAGEGPLAEQKEIAELAQWIRRGLERCGVKSPIETLRTLRAKTVAQELAFPERASHLWHTAAAIESCPPDFIAQIHGWYDAMTSRTSQRFGLQAKIVGSLFALGLAVAVPLDSRDLIKRLSVDDKFRKELVDRAQSYEAQQQKLLAAAPSDPQAQQDLVQQLKELKAAAEKTQADVDNLREVLTIPEVPGSRWQWIKAHLAGLLLSWVLLSLGTPFWYDAMKDALKLRSLVAQKDDQDKAERQRTDSTVTPATSTPIAAGAIAASAQPVVEDEAGDLRTPVG